MNTFHLIRKLWPFIKPHWKLLVAWANAPDAFVGKQDSPQATVGGDEGELAERTRVTVPSDGRR